MMFLSARAEASRRVYEGNLEQGFTCFLTIAPFITWWWGLSVDSRLWWCAVLCVVVKSLDLLATGVLFVTGVPKSPLCGVDYLCLCLLTFTGFTLVSYIQLSITL